MPNDFLKFRCPHCNYPHKTFITEICYDDDIEAIAHDCVECKNKYIVILERIKTKADYFAEWQKALIEMKDADDLPIDKKKELISRLIKEVFYPVFESISFKYLIVICSSDKHNKVFGEAKADKETIMKAIKNLSSML